jgi:hypothetical protein
MRVSEIAIRRPAEMRLIVLEYENRTHVMRDAMRTYQELGCDCQIEHFTISYPVPKPAALYLAGMFERCTGHLAEIR